MSIIKDDEGKTNLEFILKAIVIIIIISSIAISIFDSDEKRSSNVKYEDGNVEVYEKRDGELYKVDEYNEFDSVIEDRENYLRDRGRF